MEVSKRSLLLVVTLLVSTSLMYANEPVKGFKALVGTVPAEIQELADYFKGKQSVFNDYSVKLPKGILLMGQPGIGKTSLAKALSEEIECNFIYKNASDLEDADAVEELFEQARADAKKNKYGKTVIFIDYFDVFCLQGNNAGADTRSNVLALINEMDGFKYDDSVLVIAACHADNFDKSLIRAGRFDKVVEMALPNPAQRIAMIKKFHENCKIPFDAAIDFNKIAALSFNFTPADLKQLVNHAHACAKAESTKTITDKQMLSSLITILRTKSRSDKDLTVRIKVIMDLLNKKKDEKRGFARLVGSVPDEIKELVEQIRDDARFKKFKLDIPKGILLSGPPGTGKTTLVRALSEEAGCEFMAVSGAEFVDKFVGGGSQKIRDLFKEARQKAVNSESKKTIIFIDEIDAIGTRQGNSMDSTITELLTQMDGFNEDDSIIVMAATNNPGNLDAALLRPGRFNKILQIGLPDLAKREDLLKYYTQSIPLAAGIDLKKIAKVANNFSPADLRELVQKASSLALKGGSTQLQEKHFVEGLRKTLTERMIKGEKDIQQQLDALDALFNGKENTKGFKRLAGGVEPEIEDLVKMLNGEFDYASFGLPFPKGILLAGPPGTGKTALVRALAEESGCEFIQAKGSDFIEKYVGVGAQRVRELFDEARKKAKGNAYGKTIIFIDELDAIGSRSTSDNSETQRTVTELLTQMDGFYKDESVIVIGATNAPSALDQALLRAGRFDTIIEIPLPNLAKRKALFTFYGKNRPIAPAVAIDKLAIEMEGCNAADIKNLIDKAAQLAMRAKQKTISQQHFDQALAAIQAAEDKKNTRYV